MTRYRNPDLDAGHGCVLGLAFSLLIIAAITLLVVWLSAQVIR